MLARQKARHFIARMFCHIEHGDAEHRRWLSEKLSDFEKELEEQFEACWDEGRKSALPRTSDLDPHAPYG